MRSDIVRGCNRAAWFFIDGDPGAIRARTIAGFCEPFSPGVQISVIRRGQAAAFFNIEKNDRLRWKAFALCGGSRDARVETSLLDRCRFAFEFTTQRAAVQK